MKDRNTLLVPRIIGLWTEYGATKNCPPLNFEGLGRVKAYQGCLTNGDKRPTVYSITPQPIPVSYPARYNVVFTSMRRTSE